MKYILFIGLLLHSFWQCDAQKKDLKNVIMGGKSAYTFTNINISTDKQNNKYVHGIFLNEFKLGNHSVQTQMHDAYYLSKINKLDSVEWLIKIAETRYNKIEIITSTITDSFCYLAIKFEDTIVVNSNNYISKGDKDILLLQIKNNGQFISIKQIGSENYEGFSYRAMTVNDDNEVFFVGSFGATGGISASLIIGSDTLTTNKVCSFIIKIDANGNYKWAKMKGNISGIGYGNIFYYENALYVFGYSTNHNFQIDSININVPFDYTEHYFITKLDTTGKAIWAKYFGIKTNLGVLFPIDIIASNGRVYFAGYGKNADGDLINRFYFNNSFNPLTGITSNSWDYFIASYDTSGIFKWAKISKGYGSENIRQLSSDSIGNLLAVGKCDDLVNGSDTINGNVDIFVTSLDSNGNYLWSTSAGGSGIEVGNGIATTTDGEIYVVGGTESSTCYFEQDIVQVDSLPSMFLAKIVNANPVGIGQLALSNEQWEVFPNPVSTMLEIRCPMFGKKEIQLYNAVGHLILNQKTDYQISNIETSKLPEGIYFLQLKQNGKTSTKKISIIH